MVLSLLIGQNQKNGAVVRCDDVIKGDVLTLMSCTQPAAPLRSLYNAEEEEEEQKKAF